MNRSLALVLAVVIACHVLPLTLAQGDYSPSAAQGEAALSFEPLQVCDDGSNLFGLLADHPWVAGSVVQAPIIADRSFCPSLPETVISAGITRAVYRPPRFILS